MWRAGGLSSRRHTAGCCRGYGMRPSISQRVPHHSSEINDPPTLKRRGVRHTLPCGTSYLSQISCNRIRGLSDVRDPAPFATWPGWDHPVRGHCRRLAPMMPPAQEPYHGSHTQSQEDCRFPTKPFDPKAVTRASWEPERKKPPKKDGPLVSFDRHPEYVVAFLVSEAAHATVALTHSPTPQYSHACITPEPQL